MKLFLVFLLICTSNFASSSDLHSDNSTAEQLQTFIKKHKIEYLTITYKTGLLSKTEFHTSWTFPGNNYIEVMARAYNLSQLKYFEIEGVKEKKTLKLRF